jgi:hypothetical protein
VFGATKPAVDVQAQLTSLPVEHLTFHVEGGWLVIGPTGLFVLTSDDGDLEGAARRAVERAQEVRDRLSQELVWVPYVDPLVATADPEGPRQLPCLAIPADLVTAAIVEGPQTVDNETLAKLGRLQLNRAR